MSPSEVRTHARADTARADGQVLRNTLGGAGWLGVGAGVTKLSQTLVLLVLAALLAPEALGVLAIGALILNVTSAVTDLGSSTALVYWRGNVERAARSALTVALLLAVILTVSIWALAPWLSTALRSGGLGVEVIRGLILCLPLYSVAGVSQELLRRDLAFKRRVLPDIVGATIGSVLAILLAMSGHGVHSLVAGQLVTAGTVMLLCWVMRPPVLPGWNVRDVTGLISYGGHLAGGNILRLLMLNLDYLIVARILGSEPLGIYSMSFRLAYMPYLLVAVVVGGAAFATLCRLEGPAVGRTLLHVVRLLAVVTVPLYLGMALLAPQIGLLGDKWAPGVPALRLLAAYGLVLGFVHLAIVALNAINRTRDGLVLNIVHLVLLAGLLTAWTNRGIEMVAAAQLVAGLGTLAPALWLLWRRLPGPVRDTGRGVLLPIAVGGTGMTTVALFCHVLMPWSVVSVGGLLLVGTLMVVAYTIPVALMVRSRGLVPDFREAL